MDTHLMIGIAVMMSLIGIAAIIVALAIAFILIKRTTAEHGSSRAQRNA